MIKLVETNDTLYLAFNTNNSIERIFSHLK